MNDIPDVTEQTELDFPEDTRLFNIAIWSGTIGWLVLILGLLRAVLDLVRMFRNGVFNPIAMQLNPFDSIVMILSYAQPILTPIILWFVLQAFKEFLFLMIDIKENLQADSMED
jgi:hypothetical protein